MCYDFLFSIRSLFINHQLSFWFTVQHNRSNSKRRLVENRRFLFAFLARSELSRKRRQRTVTMAIDTLLSAAHLRRELGEELFAALVSRDNIEVVRKFVETLTKVDLYTEMIVGGRSYDILGFLEGDEKFTYGFALIERAKQKNANSGKEEREHLLKHQYEIPFALRGKITFVFTEERRSDGTAPYVCVVYWNTRRWCKKWRPLNSDYFDGSFRVLHRKQSLNGL